MIDPTVYASTHPLELDEVAGERGVVKWTRHLTATGAAAGRVGGAHGRVELRLYRSAVVRPPFAPRLLAADPGRGRLVLELIEGTPLDEALDPSAWVSTAALIPTVQRALQSARRWLPDSPAAPSLDRLPVDQQDRAAAIWGRAQPLLAGGPRVAVHGDLHAANVMVRSDGSIVVLDWEHAHVDAAEVDLATLISGPWSEDERAAMVAAHHTAAGVEAASADPRLAAARALVCLRELTTGSSWSPPHHHDNDWWGELLTIAAEQQW